MSSRGWIWEGPQPFLHCARRQAADYVAFVRTLDRERPLRGGEREFLALHEFVRSCGEDGVAVHGDPYARLWTRIAFALLRSVRHGEGIPPEAAVFARTVGETEPRALLRCHLDEFKRLALGASVRSNRRLVLETPLRLALPAALPGADAAVVGSGDVSVCASANGRLDTADGGIEPTPCPRVRVEGLDLPLQPHGYAVPALDWMPSAGRTDLLYQASQTPLVEAGLRLVARHVPRVFEQMRAVLRWIALNPMSEYTGTNYVSYSDLPGAFAFRAVPNPYSAAEACIHEFHHNRLFALEAEEPLLAPAPGATDADAVYYSPWRDEPRPIRGLLHAVYVTLAQTELWLSVYADESTDEPVRRFATDQLVRHPLMIDLGMRQLERFAPFTPRGRELLSALHETRRAHDDATRRLGVPDDAPLHFFHDDGSIHPATDRDGESRSVRALVAGHVREFDTRGQVAAETT